METRRVCLVLLVVAAVLVAASATFAQETRGKITGRVTDTSKAVIPGATVTVTDMARGTTATAVTNEQGLYLVNYLLPGTYKVEIELQGFKKHVQQNVQLQISETRDLNVVLEVGAMEESVSVVAEAVTVNTTDASLGLTVDQNRLSSLPLIHGDPYKIMGLATGLTHTGDQRLDRPFEPTHIIGFAMDGTRGNRSDLLIDGLPSTATANANEVIATYVPALGPGPGVPRPDGDLRRAVRQHRGRRHQHEHQVRHEQVPRDGVLLRRAVGAGRQRLLRESARPGEDRQQFEPARLHDRRPARLPRPGQREGQDLVHVRLRADHRQAPALRHRGHLVGADRGPAQRRLLGLLRSSSRSTTR